MVYNLQPHKVKQNRVTLEMIYQHVQREMPLTLTPDKPENMSKMAYNLHELLKCAELFPQTSYDKQLKSSVTIRQDSAEGVIKIIPKPGASVGIYTPGGLVDASKAIEQLRSSKESVVEIEWVVREDRNLESQAFKNQAVLFGWEPRLQSDERRGGRQFLTWKCYKFEEAEPPIRPKALSENAQGSAPSPFALLDREEEEE